MSHTLPWIATLLIAASGVNSFSYDHILHAFVKNDRIDYAALRRPAAHAALTRYLKALSEAKLADEGDAKAQLAARLNAYNALTLETKLSGPAKTYQVYGQSLTLQALAAQATRDPRAYFALSDGTTLRAEAYYGHRLDTQLDDQVRHYLADPAHARFDKAHKAVKLSPFLKAHAKELGNLPKFLARYTPNDWVTRPGVKITWL